MAKPDRKKNPKLATAWDAYGHVIPWEDLIDAKFGRHGYVALAWMEYGMVNYADLSQGYGPNGQDWEMQNDSHDTVELAVWKKAKVVPECDWLDIDVPFRSV